MASSAAGIGFLVVFGLVAIGYSNGEFGSESGDGEPDLDDELVSHEVDEGEELETCDGVVVVDSEPGSVRVPGDTDLLDGTTVVCDMQQGDGDDEAVAVLQQALVDCHGQDVTIDGEYGPETAGAVTAVQRQAGIDPDGEYGPATLQVMRWPVDGATGTPECAASASQGAVVDDASAGLPATR
jgi:hypothetical protein